MPYSSKHIQQLLDALDKRLECPTLTLEARNVIENYKKYLSGDQVHITQIGLLTKIAADSDLTAIESDIMLYLILLASENNKTELSLLKALGVNIKDIGRRALMAAISLNRWEAAKILIAQGADLSEKNERGYSPLMLIALKSDEDFSLLSLLENSDIGIKKTQDAYKEAKFMSLVKEAGHILGIGTKVSNADPNGNYSMIAYELLGHCLDNLPNELQSTTIKQSFTPSHGPLREAFELAQGYSESSIEIALPYLSLTTGYTRKFAKPITHKELIAHHRKGQITLFPVGFEKHSISVIAWNDILIVCNRGYEKFEDCITIVKIPESGINEQFLQKILPQDEVPSEQILEGIKELGWEEIGPPLLPFHVREQGHATCSFANLKASLWPLSCFIKLLNSRNLKIEDFNSELLKTFSSKEFETARAEARTEYKATTKAMRDTKIQQMIQTFKNLPPNSFERKLYFDLFSSILMEHHGQKVHQKHGRSLDKINDERIRATWILNSFSPAEKQEFLTAFFSRSTPIDSDCLMWWKSQVMTDELRLRFMNLAVENDAWDVIEDLYTAASANQNITNSSSAHEGTSPKPEPVTETPLELGMERNADQTGEAAPENSGEDAKNTLELSRIENEFNQKKSHIQQQFKTHLDQLHLKIQTHKSQKNANLYTTLDKAQEDFFSQLTPKLDQKQLNQLISNFRIVCNDNMNAANKLMGQGWLYRAVEILIKAVLGLFVGIGMVLGAVVGQGIAKSEHREQFKNTFFTFKPNEQLQAVDQFKKEILGENEENQGLISSQNLKK